MVNIDLLVEVRLLVNGLTGAEIEAAFLEKQGIKALVGGTVAGLQRSEALWSEVGVRDRGGFGATIKPGQELGNILGELSLNGAPIQLAENPAPIPSGELGAGPHQYRPRRPRRPRSQPLG